jgi:TPR repeat protein
MKEKIINCSRAKKAKKFFTLFCFELCFTVCLFSQTARDYRVAAEKGDKDAQFNLGICYADGIGITKDLTQAVYWYSKSAEQGNSDAQFNLGLCYENGKGVIKDIKQAVNWYLMAAEQGNANAQYRLGFCYHYNKSIKNLSQSVYWFRMASEQGNALAQFTLGVCYYKGKGVTVDKNIALYWFEKTIENKDNDFSDLINSGINSKIKNLKSKGYSSSNAKM